MAAALLASCGGSEPAELADVPESSVEPETVVSPLEASLGFASEPGQRQYQLVQRQREADAALVQCMDEAGFFYAVPRVENLLRGGAFVGDGSRTWTSQNGLGIASAFAGALMQDGVQDAPDAAAANLAYVGGLTAEQAAAYDLALVGEITTDPADPAAPFTPAGCWGASYTELLRLVAIIDEFEPKLASLNGRMVSDPRVVELEQAWSECMDAAGYRYGNRQAMVDDVYAQLLDVQLVDSNGATQIASPEDFDLVLGFERSVAVASFDCRDSLAADFRMLRDDYEQEFLDDNRFRIAELNRDG